MLLVERRPTCSTRCATFPPVCSMPAREMVGRRRSSCGSPHRRLKSQAGNSQTCVGAKLRSDALCLLSRISVAQGSIPVTKMLQQSQLQQRQLQQHRQELQQQQRQAQLLRQLQLAKARAPFPLS